MMYNFDHKKLMTLVKAKAWSQMWLELDSILEGISSFDPKSFSNQLALDLHQKKRKTEAQGFIDILGKFLWTCLNSDDIPLPDEAYEKIIFNNETIHAVFYFAQIKGANAVAEKLILQSKKPSDQHQKKAMLLLNLDESNQILPLFNKVQLQYRAVALCACLGAHRVFSMKAHNNKAKLIGLSKDLRQLPYQATVLQNIIRAYFSLSYIDAPNKHAPKKDINHLMEYFLKEHEQVFKKDAQPIQYNNPEGKPILIILIESMSGGHAMYRSWKSRLHQFREKFHTVIFGIEDMVFNPKEHGYCDEYVSFKQSEDMCRQLFAANADVIFCPSVGMTMATIFFSNYRFAPVQIMGLGHPANTHSKYIDYVIGRQDYYAANDFKDDVYIIEDSKIHHIPPEGISKEDIIDHPKKPAGEPLKITVCGMVLKLSAPFLEFVAELIAQLETPVEVSVITSTKGLEVLMFDDFIKQKIPQASIIAYPGYQKYFNLLQQSDIVLNPFPFGHSHTMIDALLAGCPVISLCGEHAHGRTEFGVLNDLGLANQFVVRSKEEYGEKFKAITEKILAGENKFFDPQEIYYKVFEKPYDYNFADLLMWIYQNHETINIKKGEAILPDLPAIQQGAA